MEDKNTKEEKKSYTSKLACLGVVAIVFKVFFT
jgi:hypothetical protein